MFKDTILSYLKHSPTNNQSELIDHLDNFFFKQELANCFILRGYAGTGKTTIIAALVKTLPKFKMRSVLMAPTGRAAKVLASYSSRKAFTIHKKIYMSVHDKDGNQKFILKENKHTDTVFIVDEASMVSDLTNETSLFSRNLLEDLLMYVDQGENCKLIFVGDTAQLPPVGSDLSPALSEEYLFSNFSQNAVGYELTEVVRQALESGVLRNASNIRHCIATERIKFPYLKTKDLDDFIRLEGYLMEDKLRDEYKENGVEDVVVICRSNRQANIFNQQIRYRILDRENEIDVGDHIMVVKNNYFWLDEFSDAGFIANGDILVIKKILRYKDFHGFRFADIVVRLLDYPNHPSIECSIFLDTLSINAAALSHQETSGLFYKVMEDYKDLKTKQARIKAVKEDPYFNALQVKFAYALTCHKAQGGQWNSVFVDQGYFTDEMHNVEFLRWLYTALTRAKSKIYLTNFKDDFFVEQNDF